MRVPALFDNTIFRAVIFIVPRPVFHNLSKWQMSPKPVHNPDTFFHSLTPIRLRLRGARKHARPHLRVKHIQLLVLCIRSGHTDSLAFLLFDTAHSSARASLFHRMHFLTYRPSRIPTFPSSRTTIRSNPVRRLGNILEQNLRLSLFSLLSDYVTKPADHRDNSGILLRTIKAIE